MSMMLDICAGVDPEANRDAVNKVEECFDAEMSGYGDAILDNAIGSAASPRSVSQWTSSRRFSPPQRRRSLHMGVFRLVWRFVRWLFRAVSRWR